MTDMHSVITENIDVWTGAIKKRNATGRGSSKKLELIGVSKLRSLILELAVRGKLVVQNLNDEPASELIARATKEKDRLIAENKIKKTKIHPAITEDDWPFALPNGWEWARLPDISYYSPGKTPSTKNSLYWEDTSKGIPWVSIADMGHYQEINETNKCVSQEASIDVFKRNPVEAGTILMSFKLTVGKISILGIDAYHNEAIIAVSPFEGISKEFLYRFLPSRALAGNTKKAIMGNTLNAESLSKIMFPVPPLAEQKRIVAKVDELMALCDQLEQQTEESIAAHKTLVETLLGALTNSADAKDFQQSWKRIAQHFDILFTTEDSIDQLKQTILQLAVMGKLVPQDPNDEPASVLLEKIAKEKERLVAEGKIKKQKALPPISEEEKPFELPEGWEWAKFGSLVNFKAELVKPEEYQSFEQVAPDSIEKGTGRLLKRRTVKESGVKGPNSRFYTGQLLYSKIRPSLSKVIIADFDGLCSADMYPLESMIDSNYLLQVMLAEVFLTQVRVAENRIKMPKLNIVSLSNIIVPIAPNDEQKKIVKTIDELMSLCDQLTAQLSDAQNTQLHLADAIVEWAVG